MHPLSMVLDADHEALLRHGCPVYVVKLKGPDHLPDTIANMSASFVFRADEKTGNSMTLDCFVRIPSQTIQSPYPSAPSLSSAHEIHPIFIATAMLPPIIPTPAYPP